MTDNQLEIKKRFALVWEVELKENPYLRRIILEICVEGSVYVVGGFFRDFLHGKRARDIDLLVDLPHQKLLRILLENKVSFSINRHKGMKLNIGSRSVDMWSIENNWAFKNELVKLNEQDKLHSIAKGCFFNYDALVINLHRYNFNLQYYKQFLIEKKLDILQKSSKYKYLNPTPEANILRMLFLKQVYGIRLSSNSMNYIFSEIGAIKDQGNEPLNVLLESLNMYEKYKSALSKEVIEANLKRMTSNVHVPGNQILLEL